MQINDQEMFSYLAFNAEDASVRWMAVSRIDNPETLKHVVLHDEDAGVRRQAVSRIDGLETLERVSLNDEDAGVRAEALARLNKKHYCRHSAAERVCPDCGGSGYVSDGRGSGEPCGCNGDFK